MERTARIMIWWAGVALFSIAGLKVHDNWIVSGMLLFGCFCWGLCSRAIMGDKITTDD